MPASHPFTYQSGLPEFLAAIMRLLAAAVLLCLAAPATAEPLMQKTGFSTQAPWQITADRLTYEQKTNLYRADGGVVVQKDNLTLTADRVLFDQDAGNARAEGNVLLISNADRLSGDVMDIDLNAGTGTVSQGELFVEQKHFFIRGEHIRKTGDYSFSITRGSLTSCDGEPPDWRLTGSEVDVTVEGYGTAKHATLWARNLPVFYVPYVIFPVKLERQSGLLPPQVGYAERRGISYTQPFFWAVSRSADATFYYQHMQKRGEKLGGEYRYELSDDSRGILMIDGFTDRHIDDGTPEASRKWGYPDDRAIRPNTDRYWFRMKADQELFWRLNAKLDLDVVSDQDYLREFSSGYMGYNDANDDFRSRFGRDLDDKNSRERENRLNINRIWTTYSFNTDVAWYDNVINRRLNDTDPTLQNLPRVAFSGLKHPLPATPLFLDLTSEYTYFYRQDGSTGHRADFHPRLYLPLHWRQYLSLEPSAGFRQTAWRMDRRDTEARIEDDRHRELFDFRVDLSSDLYRVFNVNAGSFEKIRHTFAPKIQYLYIPEQNQSEYPLWDELDRIGETNRIVFSVVNLINSVEDSGQGLSGPYRGPVRAWRSGRPLGRLLIEQPYDINQRDASDADPFAPLYMQLELDPSDRLSFRADAAWSHEERELAGHSLRISFFDQAENRFSCEHRYRRDTAQSLYLDAAYAVIPSILLIGEYERNLERHHDIRKSIGCQYRAQCWAFWISFAREEDDKSIGFMITLSGLGDIGSR